MTIHPVLLTIWAILAAAFFALLIYRGQLSRYEDDQLFLNNENDPNEQKHQQLVSKMQKIAPLVRIFGGAAGLVTASVVGLYVWQAWLTIR